MKKLLSQGLVVAALLSLSVPTAALAQIQQQTIPPVSSQEVVLGPLMEGQDVQLPKLMIFRGSTTELHLLNPQPYAVQFNSPALGLSFLIPANSERVAYLDQSLANNLSPGQEIGYYVTDTSGERLAYSSIVNEPTIASQINTNREVVIVEEYQTISPGRISHPKMKRRATVRGFW